MKKITLLGSTGSIGQNTLVVAQHLGPDQVAIQVLVAHSNIELLAQQIQLVKPKLVAVYQKDKAKELQKQFPKLQILGGMEGVIEAASYPESNFVVSAMSGTLGLIPTVAAIKAGKDIGLANKETLVSGGALVIALAKQKNVSIIPIDSEHSAIFQCLQGEKMQAVSRLILTASGGPFRTWTPAQLQHVSVEQALAHPNWKMGPKITIDCSTLMNKGLEAIEAHWLFDMPYEKIAIVIHPQSLIHSLVEFVDSSLLAQLSAPSMCLPIQYALTYPYRQKSQVKPFDFQQYATLQFFEPDYATFKCLRLALEAIQGGGSLPCYMNAANEILVQRFLNKNISWLEIGDKLETLMQAHSIESIHSIEQILSIDQQARREAVEINS